MKPYGIIAMILAILAIGTVFSVTVADNSDGADACNMKAKNVIMMVPDGCSQSVQTLARWYKGEPLALDSMNSGTVSTYMFNSIITDSAPAATAFATGHKTSDKFIGVAPDPSKGILSIYDQDDYTEDKYEPLATILEGAKLQGMSTGLIATSTITHATPAAFGAHVDSRSNENGIMGHLIYNDIDVIMGGGSALISTARSSELSSRGYTYITTGTQLEALDSDDDKVFGLFSSSSMQPDQDRQWKSGNDEPTLAEMTEAAIEVLSQNKKGFFLMVEGSQVDWAGHANDPFYMVTDFIAFDDAVKVAVDFAKKNKNTQVIAFPDHNTGGLSLGNSRSDSTYTSISIEMMVDPVEAMKCTYNVLEQKLEEIDDTSSTNGVSCDNDEFRTVFKQWWGVQPTDAQISEMGIDLSNGITYYQAGPPIVYDEIDGYKISQVFCKYHTYIGWTTHGHVGDDVPLWTYGPNDIDGFFDNTELAYISADLMGFDLDKVQSKLYNEVTSANLDSWKIDHDSWTIARTPSDTNDNVGDGDLKVVLEDYTIVMPLDKDMLYVYKNSDNSLKYSANLDGLTVHVYKTGTDRVFISKEAIKIMELLD